jgi:hypothetical protein
MESLARKTLDLGSESAECRIYGKKTRMDARTLTVKDIVQMTASSAFNNGVQIWDHGKVKRGSDGGSQRNPVGDLRRARKHMRRAVGAKFRFGYDRNHDDHRYACKNAA